MRLKKRHRKHKSVMMANMIRKQQMLNIYARSGIPNSPASGEYYNPSIKTIEGSAK